MRHLAALLALSAVIAPTAVLASDAYTTRIEPRPYYGATVTLEEGVRVFRPLPPHKHIIINPGSQTPVNLSFNETRETNTHNYHGVGGGSATPAPVYGGGLTGWGNYGTYARPYRGDKAPRRFGVLPPGRRH